ncbi:LANO_0H10440g1_1 [Lachancea nothofagi CBS 11611]|uniref:Signal recognition particle receptor subunit alpha homolog n=1 Tax=Lachancea nothofagi CBS 11611 TaxID=1266666 RepID=A0A1G4KLZ1_9SACH|nr:LANO_0H10440g1_1 [Lachancea nothofagi CBS 11611]
MIDQFVVFTSHGQVLYSFSPQGKRLAELQVNKVVSHLITTPARKDELGHKYIILKLDHFVAACHLEKQPPIIFLTTYVAQDLELNREAEQVLDLGTKLWASLGLNETIELNLGKKAPKNEHNYTWVLENCDEQITKFDEYFKAKFNTIKPGKLKGKEPSQVNRAGLQATKPGKKVVSNAKSRKWGRDGVMEDSHHGDTSALDFSAEGSSESTPSAVTEVNKDSFGIRTNKGEFLIKEIDALLSKNKSDVAKNASSSAGAFGFLQKHLLGNKKITEDDLTKVLDKLKHKLITKNVAPEAADHLTSRISQNLVGTTTANWTSVEITARESLQQSLTEILTPGVSVDLLREIQQKTGSTAKKAPYVFSVVGVNGVGKSTNLSKLAFWLLQNNFRVLIVACDTFRSGAVEQLRVHVENLAQLTDEAHTRGSKNKRGKTGNDFVELFEAGYGGSDLVTKIAKQAIKYANDQSFDVVLMDTAGRRHNDPTLMSPLKPFADQAKPDKIIMVGEALVGTDSVQQAKNFNAAFGKERNLDFFIISKCDTVGEMLGTMVNMVYATGIPILFVGVGQTYTDLRTLSVEWAVDTLMS